MQGGYHGHERGGTTGKREYLHVAVWIHHFGPVPKGWDVHHKDHDKDNPGPKGFTPDNLELLEKPEHGKRHHYKTAKCT